MKKGRQALIALGVAVSLLSFASAGSIEIEGERTRSSSSNLVEEKGHRLSSSSFYNQKRGIPSMELYHNLLERIETDKEKKDIWNVDAIVTKEDYFALRDRINKELPYQVVIKDSKDKRDVYYDWDSEYNTITPSMSPNHNLLANYALKYQLSGSYTITDSANTKYSAKTIEKALDIYSERFARSLKGLTDEEKVHTIYNFIYEEFDYKASNYQAMMVGNAYSYELACNGFTRLFYALATASGLETKMVRGDDHYWNQWKTKEGQWITVDITTDIVLKKKHGATGLSKEDHITYVSNVGFYFARPVPQETSTPNPWTKEQKEKFLHIKVK